MFRVNIFLSSLLKRYVSNKCNQKCFENIPIYCSNIKSELEIFWKDKLMSVKQDALLAEKMYVLSMFPYPSGNLHMGHMRVYTVADSIARYYRLCNKSVIFPMGWDSFGLPAENAAFERGLEPRDWTVKNIDEMKKQMKDQMTLSIDWDMEISTCDPKYFKWTQWIFARLFEKGFAYQRSDLVNWDPVDCTVLANELIDQEGRSWRSGAIVEKKPLKQWNLKTTALTESLLAGLETIDGKQWRHVIDVQQGWLGKLEGCYVELDLIDLWNNGACLEQLAVFTSSPVAVLSDFVSFVEINEDNVWWKISVTQISEYPTVHNRLAVRHPISKRIIPIVRNPNLKFNKEECVSARFGIPFLDVGAARIASKLGIPSSTVHLGAFNSIKGSVWKVSEGLELNDHLEQSLMEQAMKTLQDMNRGGYRCSKLRIDWLISRQRYWGTPIPIIHCPDCGPVLVPDHELPIELPHFSECKSSNTERGTKSPLASVASWVNVSCPKCGNVESKRETDTMDTFVDSSWYYLRYLDSRNESDLCASESVRANMPVDIYIGGIEHAIRHLFYARFIAHFLHYYCNIKWPGGPEPFSKFLPVGLILGQTYQTKLGQFVASNKVTFRDDNKKKPMHSDTGEEVTEFWDKMSKSKKNGINPDSVVQKYGLDLSRLILLANTGPDRNRKWQDNDVSLGIVNWEKRLWKLVKTVIDEGCQRNDMFVGEDSLMTNSDFIENYHFFLRRAISYYGTYTFSSVIAALQRLTNDLLKTSTEIECHQSILFYRVLFDCLVLLHPLSPLLSCELWAQLSSSVAHKESFFLDNQDKYSYVCGDWNYNLNKPVWEQSIVALVEEGSKLNEAKRLKVVSVQ